jgi:hypothetical protein
MILKLLRGMDHFGVSEEVEIAKGKYELTTNFKKRWKQEVRRLKYNKHTFKRKG